MKNLLASFFAVIVIFTAITLTLHSPIFHRYLLSTLQRGTVWQISFSDANIRLLRGAIQIRGLEVQAPEGKFAFQANRIYLNLSPLSLLRGKLIVSNLEVDQPHIKIERSGGKPKKTQEMIRNFFDHLEHSWILSNLILDRITIVDFFLEGTGMKPISLKKIALHLEPTVLREIEIGIDLEDASALIPALQKFRIDLAASKDGLKLKNLDLETDKIRLALKGEWKGEIEKGSLAVEGEMEAPRVLAEPLRFSLDSKVAEKIATLKIESHLGVASFHGTGSFRLDNLFYDLSFEAKDLPLESIFQKINSIVLAPAKGMGEVKGKAVGQLPRLAVKADAMIREFKHGPLSARKAEGTINLDWPNLDFDAAVQPGPEDRTEAHVKGGVAFKHLPGFEKLQAVTRNVDLTLENASLEEILPSSKLSGKIDGQMHLEGGQGTSVQGKAHAHVTNAQWVFGPVNSLVTDVSFHPGGKMTFSPTEFDIPGFATIVWPGPVELNPEGGTVFFSGEPGEGISLKGNYQLPTEEFRIEALHIRREGGNLDGALHLGAEGKGEAKLKGAFNLEWLRFFPFFIRDARGITNVNLEASGSVKNPLIRGTLEFLKDDLEIRGYPIDLSDLQGLLKVDGSNLYPKLSGQLGDGEFKMDGRVKLENLKPEEFDITFKGTGLSYARPNVYRIDFDTDVTLKGRLPSPRLEGRIDIVDGIYFKPFVVRELVLRPFEQGSEPTDWEKAIGSVQLNLGIKNSGDLKINNNIASILMRSDLQVSGTYGRPRISGALLATEGLFHYLGKDFNLDEGRLEFLDPSRDEPYLTLSAHQEIPPEYLILLEVKGYLSDLHVNLASVPSLSREDILSLVAFGMTQDEIRQSGKSKRSLSSGILAEEVSGMLERPLFKSTGLDVFRLEASETGSLSRVSLGKNLTDRFSLEFTSDFAPETAERTVQANYYLTDNILLKGFRTQTAGTTPRYQFNVSFRFRRR